MFKTTVNTNKSTNNSTNLLLTINSNKVTKPDSDYDQLFKRTIIDICNNLEEYINPKAEAYGLALNNNIVSAENTISFEYSTKGFVHCHIFIRIVQKKGYYLINLPVLRQNVISKLGDGRNIHIDVRRISSVDEAKKYLEKSFSN